MKYLYTLARMTAHFCKYDIYGEVRRRHPAPYLYLPKGYRRALGDPFALQVTLEAAPDLTQPAGVLLYYQNRTTNTGKWVYTATWTDHTETEWTLNYYLGTALVESLGNPAVLRVTIKPLTLELSDIFPELKEGI